MLGLVPHKPQPLQVLLLVDGSMNFLGRGESEDWSVYCIARLINYFLQQLSNPAIASRCKWGAVLKARATSNSGLGSAIPYFYLLYVEWSGPLLRIICLPSSLTAIIRLLLIYKPLKSEVRK